MAQCTDTKIGLIGLLMPPVPPHSHSVATCAPLLSVSAYEHVCFFLAAGFLSLPHPHHFPLFSFACSNFFLFLTMLDPLTSILDDTFEGPSQVVPAWVPDEVDNYDKDYDYTLPPAKLPPHPPSLTTLDSSCTLALSFNKPSLPSGLPKDTIA